jgi:hypothetical protein
MDQQTNTDLDLADEDISSLYDVSDDALEAAAGTAALATMGPGSCWFPGGGRVC